MEKSNKKNALIFEGGGMRGTYTTGAVDYLIEQNKTFDAVYGVSAGSCHALSLLSRQKGRARDVNVNYCTRKDYFGLHCYLKEHSFFGWKLIFDEIPNTLYPFDYKTFFTNANASGAHTHYEAVVTNALTGHAAYLVPHTYEEILCYCKASCSLPFLCPPVIINGVPYFDGGVADSIPIQHALDEGCTHFTIVLTQPSGFHKEQMNHIKLIRALYRKYPKLVDAMEARASNYNTSLETVARLEHEGRARVLRPQPTVIVGRTEMNPEKLLTLYEAGYADAKAAAL